MSFFRRSSYPVVADSSPSPKYMPSSSPCCLLPSRRTGHVYFTAQLPAHAVRKQRLDRLPDKLIVKWGESSCLPRRQLQYDDCAVGRTHMWISAFHVKRRLLAGESSFAFLSCSRIGSPPRSILPALLVRPPPPEYNYMRPGGSLEEIAAIARECVAQIGEPDPLQ
ncbi:hypothetical protein B0H12DRAFT_1242296 [Mycena haematopus]|nr:hypothetical protein B0H12DRAFT_1242296 [Mycena haematopus]